MPRRILFAAALLLLGAIVGSAIARYSARQHQHSRAVMALAQFHLDRLASASQRGQCTEFALERERLGRIYDELLQAFPLAYAQDAEFHTRADALHAALTPADGAGGDCAAASVKRIRDACDDCHRDYR